MGVKQDMRHIAMCEHGCDDAVELMSKDCWCWTACKRFKYFVILTKEIESLDNINNPIYTENELCHDSNIGPKTFNLTEYRLWWLHINK